MSHRPCVLATTLLVLGTWGCSQADSGSQPSPPASPPSEEVASRPYVKPGVLTAGFVCTEGVFNSELMAPFDILQHSIYRDEKNYVRCVLITESGDVLTTAEGLRLLPDHSFENAPALDIVVIPSSEHSMEGDLQNERYLEYLRTSVENALFALSLCDGAFPLAATGLMKGRSATTFPADRERLAEMFPEIAVHDDANFVVDGKFITSVGGALSYEPALYLVEELYGTAHARRSAQGLVLDWDRSQVPHNVIMRGR